ncbi:MAG: hypothetical protein IH614_09025 [Desulfuromonadales bacterium]|nr:hypothetical protein [Desulfuromonadales bacterium]
MKKHLVIILAGLLTLSLAAGCKEKTPQTAAPATPAPAAAQTKTGNVVETMNAGGYTYLQVDTGTEKIWAAAPEFAVQVGDPVVVPEGMLMTNHESKSLERTFEEIYFVDAVLVGGAQAAGAATGEAKMPQGHPPIGGATAAAEIDFSGLKKAENGQTVGEIFTNKEQLAGQDVVLRGKVVKFSPEIMGKNWLHVQDGTGSAEGNDLTVTTSGVAKVGDVVLVTGKLVADKDFGYGYKYALIVEDAQVVVE